MCETYGTCDWCDGVATNPPESDPFVMEGIYEADDEFPGLNLCDDCYDERKDDV